MKKRPIDDATVVSYTEQAKHFAVRFEPNPEVVVFEFHDVGQPGARAVFAGLWKDELSWRRGEAPLRRTGVERLVVFDGSHVARR